MKDASNFFHNLISRHHISHPTNSSITYSDSIPPSKHPLSKRLVFGASHLIGMEKNQVKRICIAKKGLHFFSSLEKIVYHTHHLKMLCISFFSLGDKPETKVVMLL